MPKGTNFIDLKNSIAIEAFNNKKLWDSLKNNPLELEKKLGPPTKWGAKRYEIVANAKDEIYLVIPNDTVIKTLQEPEELRTTNDYYIDAIIKISKDKSLRKKYLANPKETIRKEFGRLAKILSDDINIKILEDNDQVIYFVLPCVDTFLSDESLQSIAGGMLPNPGGNKGDTGK